MGCMGARADAAGARGAVCGGTDLVVALALVLPVFCVVRNVLCTRECFSATALVERIVALRAPKSAGRGDL